LYIYKKVSYSMYVPNNHNQLKSVSRRYDDGV